MWIIGFNIIGFLRIINKCEVVFLYCMKHYIAISKTLNKKRILKCLPATEEAVSLSKRFAAFLRPTAALPFVGLREAKETEDGEVKGQNTADYSHTIDFI